MKIRHYYSLGDISRLHKMDLGNLICECYFSNNFREVIDEERGISAFLVFDEYDNVCGFASVDDGMDSFHIGRLFVAFHSRGKGYGSFMLEEIRKFAKKEKYNSVSLEVVMSNVGAQKLYLKKRFFFDYINKTNDMAIMKMYTSNNVYCCAGMLFALSKVYGKNNLLKGLKDVQNCGDYKIFYPYIRSKDKDGVIKKFFETDTLYETAVFLSELENSSLDSNLIVRKLLNNYKLNDECMSQFPETKKIPEEHLKSVALCCDAFESFQKNQEILKHQRIGQNGKKVTKYLWFL